RLPARGSDLGGHRLDRVPRQVVEHQPGPGGGQRQRLRPPEPLARPGDDGYPAVQVQHQYPGPDSRPPSATNSLPVEYDDSSEARYATSREISTGSANRCSGMAFMNASALSALASSDSSTIR